MTKYFLSSFILVMLNGCNKNEIIKKKDISFLEVIEIKPNSNDNINRKITNRDSIILIVNILNSGNKEPVKFYPIKKIRIIYNNGDEQMIFCRGTLIKVAGLTYKLKNNIQNIIEY